MLQLRFVGTEKPPIWLVEERYILGSGAGCQIMLSHGSIKAHHAELLVRGEQVAISPLAEDAVVLVEGTRVLSATPLSHGMSIQLGEYPLTILDPKRQRSPAARVEAAAVSSWALQSKSTALANKLFLIEKDMVVGRARECDLSLAVAHLSRRHARLFFDDGGLWVEDLASANGTFLNGRRIERARLQGGDELAFDTLVFTVRGEQSNDAAENDKTSLRPALAGRALKGEPAAPKPAPVATRSSSVREPEQAKKMQPSVPSADNPGYLWVGIAAVVVLTGACVLYFAS